MKKLLLLPLLFAGGTLLAQDSPAPASSPALAVPMLTLDLTKPGIPVSPTFYGLMTEEINHAYDGGLYAELIRNRSFKNDLTKPAFWSLVQDGGSQGTMGIDIKTGVNTALPISLKLTVTDPGKRIGVANAGFWGIPVRPSTTYHASFYAKTDKNAGPLTVAIESLDGATTYAQAQVQSVTPLWRQYSVTLQTGTDIIATKDARFTITTTAAATYWFNLVSLFPPTYNNTPNGNRIDLMDMLAGLKPRFLRMPGGNYLEGNTFSGRFEWTRTLGPLDQRAGHQGPWGYRSSDGMGLLEFLEWCEDLKMQPVLAVFAGYVLQRDYIEDKVPLQGFVQDALDEIEYVTGDANTKWGAERARNGHPKPFPLTYVEIGNEDWFDTSGSYETRFAAFYDAIHAKYPDLKIIATMQVKSRTPDAVDDHFYRDPAAMEGDVGHYDKTKRSGPKVFVGEWATREGAWDKKTAEPTPNLGDAISDAAWLTGLERNADVVIMQCYAPLLVNISPTARQWEPDLIGYDALNSYGSPSYYAQKIFSNNIGNKVVSLSTENIPMQAGNSKIPAIFQVATQDTHTGTIYLKLVNTQSIQQAVQIEIKGTGKIDPIGGLTTLSGTDPAEVNTISEPTKIQPISAKLGGLSNSFSQTLAPYSVNVLQITATK
jgi:alpha-L-arabinofuranosidase